MLQLYPATCHSADRHQEDLGDAERDVHYEHGHVHNNDDDRGTVRHQAATAVRKQDRRSHIAALTDLETDRHPRLVSSSGTPAPHHFIRRPRPRRKSFLLVWLLLSTDPNLVGCECTGDRGDLYLGVDADPHDARGYPLFLAVVPSSLFGI